MANPNLVPLNDFVCTVLVEDVNSGTGVISSVTTGTVTAFIAIDNSPSATAADPSLTQSATYIGGANGFVAGTWLVNFDATVLTASLLNTLFNTATPYLIISRVGAVRRYVTLSYVPSLAATSS
jgi:hypothetical protein